MTAEPNALPAALVCAHVLDHRPDASNDFPFTVVADLCGDPEGMRAYLPHRNGAVVIACDRGPSRAEAQIEAAKAGIGLTAIYIQPVAGPTSLSNVSRLVRGCVAQLVSRPTTVPSVWRSDLSRGLSRRNLLRIQAPEKVVVPSIDAERCLSSEACRKCLDLCPASAIAIGDTGARIDAALCQTCGLCEPTCPTTAIIEPTSTFASAASQIKAYSSNVTSSPGQAGVSFVCRHAPAVSLDSGWMPVQVTSLGVVTVSWILAPLLLGCAAVSIPVCEICEQYAALEARVELARRIACSAGWDDSAISRGGPCPQLDSSKNRSESYTAPTAAGVGIVAEIAGLGSVEFTEVHHDSPAGLIAISDACTGSFLCASVCPTRALRVKEGNSHVEVQFDAALCTACSHCLDVCPEVEHGSIALTRAVDFAALRIGPQTLRTHARATCERCGGTLEATAMLSRITEILGEIKDDAIVEDLTRCNTCRTQAVLASGRSFLGET